MSTNTLASALAAARKGSAAVALQRQSMPAGIRAAATIQAPVVAAPAVAATPPALSNADALMIAIQRSARSVDDIMPRRMLLAAGSRGAGR